MNYYIPCAPPVQNVRCMCPCRQWSPHHTRSKRASEMLVDLLYNNQCTTNTENQVQIKQKPHNLVNHAIKSCTDCWDHAELAGVQNLQVACLHTNAQQRWACQPGRSAELQHARNSN